MSNGFVFTPPTASTPAGPPCNPPAEGGAPAPVAPATTIAGGWYPDVDLVALRAACRFDGTVTDTRLQEATLNAILSVMADLAEWAGVQTALGMASLADVPSPQIGGESRLVILWRRAVYSTVQADLNEQYRDFDATAVGERRADGLTPTIGDHRRNARWAVRDILGRSRSSVELI